MRGERLVVALGGNAIAGARGADPASQQEAVEGACVQIAGGGIPMVRENV